MTGVCLLHAKNCCMYYQFLFLVCLFHHFYTSLELAQALHHFHCSFSSAELRLLWDSYPTINSDGQQMFDFRKFADALYPPDMERLL